MFEISLSESGIVKEWQTSAIILEISDSNLETGLSGRIDNPAAIKKSQAVLKCFIDLKSSVWFTLGSEDETMF